LKGRYHWNKRNHDDLQKAIEHFEDAIALDPNYALAYAGLADSYGLLIAWGNSKPHEVCPKALEMAEKALSLDNKLAAAQTSLGYVNVVYQWDWPTAEKQYRQAIVMNPNYANAYHWLAYLLMCWQRFAEARELLDLARQLDPLSVMISANTGFCRYFERRYDEAIEESQKAVALEANIPSPHYYLGLAYGQTGDYENAIDKFNQSIKLSGGVPGDLGSLGYLFAVKGQIEDARRVIGELRNLEVQGYLSSFHIGLIHMALDELDQAFEWFDKAVDQRDFYLMYLKVDPRLDHIVDEPRFSDLFERVGLP